MIACSDTIFLRCLVLALLGAGMWTDLAAQSTREDLLFTLRSAVKTGNAAALAKCFNFAGADVSVTQPIDRTIEAIAGWSNAIVSVSGRSGQGPLEIERGGETLTLNGDWTFQIHIHRGPPPSKGFVFPAGRTPSGEYRILLTVEKSP